jgi:hypothetical protein
MVWLSAAGKIHWLQAVVGRATIEKRPKLDNFFSLAN